MTIDPIGRGINRYRTWLGRRFHTLRLAFEMFEQNGGTVIVELGTSRSFVPGGVEGCMINDTRYWNPDQPSLWDWGSGLFTRLCCEHFRDTTAEFHSVDTSADAIAISRVICSEFSDFVTYHHQSSELFLQSFQKRIDLLYMDAGEADAHAEELHHREARIVVERDLMNESGVILIDDVDVPQGMVSKGEYSIPFLLRHGFDLEQEDYQALLVRRKAR